MHRKYQIRRLTRMFYTKSSPYWNDLMLTEYAQYVEQKYITFLVQYAAHMCGHNRSFSFFFKCSLMCQTYGHLMYSFLPCKTELLFWTAIGQKGSCDSIFLTSCTPLTKQKLIKKTGAASRFYQNILQLNYDTSSFPQT